MHDMKIVAVLGLLFASVLSIYAGSFAWLMPAVAYIFGAVLEDDAFWPITFVIKIIKNEE